MSLERKIKWFFDTQSETLGRDDLELLKIGFFDNEGNVVFKKAIVKWRDFREFLDKKDTETIPK